MVFRVIASRSALSAARFGALPACLHKAIFMRCTSTESAKRTEGDPHSTSLEYPFPKHPHPTPYEIFHLKPGVAPSEVKARYYQLVRIHHPDTPHARRLPSHVSHARFQAIQAAHDVLTGKSSRGHNPFAMHTSHSHSRGNKTRPHAHRHTNRSWNPHAEWARATEEAEDHAEGRQKDQVIVLGVIAIIALMVVPFFTSAAISNDKHMSAVRNLAEARREAREHGMTRRREIRRRVRGNELDREYEEKALSPGDDPPARNTTAAAG